jgi:hypothetical protein
MCFNFNDINVQHSKQYVRYGLPIMMMGGTMGCSVLLLWLDWPNRVICDDDGVPWAAVIMTNICGMVVTVPRQRERGPHLQGFFVIGAACCRSVAMQGWVWYGGCLAGIQNPDAYENYVAAAVSNSSQRQLDRG